MENHTISDELINHAQFTNQRIKQALGEFIEHCEMSGVANITIMATLLSILVSDTATIGAQLVEKDGFLRTVGEAYDIAMGEIKKDTLQ